MNTFQNQYKEPLEKAVLMLSCLSMYLFSECVHSLQTPVFFMLCGIISFAYANGFYSVRRGICFSSGFHSLQAPTVFILFIVVSVFRVAHRATALHSDKAVESSLS